MNNELENYEEEYLDLDQVSSGGGGLPPVGEYVCRMTKLDPTTSKKGDPQLVAQFDVLEGKLEGHTIPFYFWLGAKIDQKTKRIFAPGVAQIKQSLAAIGAPLSPENAKRFSRDAHKAAKVFGTPFYNKRVRIRILLDIERRRDPDTGEMKEREVKRAVIVGLDGPKAQPNPTASASVSDSPLAGIV